MIHDKDLTRGMLKGLASMVLVIPLVGTEYLKVLFVFPVCWLIFQGIYNLEGVENDTR
jgi:hypothetical protein